VTHEIRMVDADGNADVVAAEGGGKVVWIDFAAEKSVSLPERVREMLPAS
jgi:acyl-CoA thioester hydrolase